VIEHVRAHAWPDIVRMVRLGIMTCQRGSDMIRMGPEHREGNGIWCRPKKTRKRRRAFQSGTTGNRRNIGSRKKRRLHRPCLRRQTSRAGPGGAGTPDAGSPDNFYHQAYAASHIPKTLRSQSTALRASEALRPHIECCIEAARTSSSAIATDLNERGIVAPNGGQGFPMQVRCVREASAYD
jgi:hypothetical protein